MTARTIKVTLVLTAALQLVVARAAETSWPKFRGPDGGGVTSAKNLPTTWSDKENILWQTDLPGPGSSSPVWIEGKILLTCYSGYDRQEKSDDFSKLRLHVVCLDADGGKVLWTKTLSPRLPQPVGAFGGTRWHGYATGTPTVDDKAVYVFFDKTGVFAFDHKGGELWKADLGEKFHVWGNGTPPVLSDELLICNASLESNALVALNKQSGKEVWRAEKLGSTWGAPLPINVGGETQIALMVAGGCNGYDAKKGTKLWSIEGMRDYVCNTPVFHDGVLYCASKNTHGGSNTIAIRPPKGAGEPELLWKNRYGPAVSSPAYSDGRLYFTNVNQRTGREVWCLDAKTGDKVYREAFDPQPDVIYASPLLSEGKLYYVSQLDGTFVVATGPEFKMLAQNKIEADDSVFNASPVPLGDGKLLLRSDKRLYCIGNK